MKKLLYLFFFLTFQLVSAQEIFCYSQLVKNYIDLFCVEKYEKINNNATKTKYIYLNDTLIATLVSVGTTPTINYVLTDHLGSTEKVLDTGGNILSSTTYLPYGEISSQTGDTY